MKKLFSSWKMLKPINIFHKKEHVIFVQLRNLIKNYMKLYNKQYQSLNFLFSKKDLFFVLGKCTIARNIFHIQV